MPYILTDVAHHDGVAFQRGDIVSDELGDAMRNGHEAKLTRFQHDDDLCAAGGLDCDHLQPDVHANPAQAIKTEPPDRKGEE